MLTGMLTEPLTGMQVVAAEAGPGGRPTVTGAALTVDEGEARR